MYKLIFSDLDETLLVNHHVPEVNQEAIKKAQRKGVKVIPCTGRAFNMIPEIIKEMNTYEKESEYSVCFNGGLIVENKNSTVLRFKGLSFEDTKEVFETARDLDVCVLIFSVDCCYIFHADPDEVQRKTDQKAPFKVIDEYNMDVLKDQKIAKILMETRDANYLKNVYELLPDHFMDKYNISFSSNRYMEFNAKGVDKGEAVIWLSNYLNIPVQDTIGIGDNYNDVQMIEKAGLGCAVKCAGDDIKKIADYVCEKDYFEGAVSEVIDKFVMEGN
ncbi:MAG: Cof-type HAD-IIB family hydrolase [Thomasclavelia sp.]|jgi:Cof subfamily protein (haloacid dehalogenase superfamily)|nr:Cof-type HAD-IIB family hydrolase [Thomasclavelia sp.]